MENYYTENFAIYKNERQARLRELCLIEYIYKVTPEDDYLRTSNFIRFYFNSRLKVESLTGLSCWNESSRMNQLQEIKDELEDNYEYDNDNIIMDYKHMLLIIDNANDLIYNRCFNLSPKCAIEESLISNSSKIITNDNDYTDSILEEFLCDKHWFIEE